MTTGPTGGVAVIAVTRGGARLGGEIAATLAPGAALHVASRWLREAPAGAVPIDEPLTDRVGALFARSTALLFVLAAGATIRLVAPLLASKQADPAVLVVDEAGRYVVPLLGGHQAEANALAARIADAIGAEPVVTTASDVLGLPALDLLGHADGWRIEASPETLKRASAAAVAGADVAVYQEAGSPDVLADRPASWPRLASPAALAEWRGPALVVTDRRLETLGIAETAPNIDNPLVVYRPPTLVVGVGCSLGAPAEEIEALARAALRDAGLAWESVGLVATIDRRLEEPGVLALAQRAGARLVGFSAEALAAVVAVPTPSAEVARHVGTPSVSEAAALLASDGGSLVVPKLKSAHATVAVARRPTPARRGRLTLVGLGPGALDLLTPRARRALREADRVIGYRGYLEMLAGLVPDRRQLPYDLGQERERAADAIGLARQGRPVALVSSGDVGIYGMAGLVFELLDEAAGSGERPDVDVEVVPGITAASAAGTLLGAPLMLDFAAISLSDLLVPWDTIRRRLVAAMSGDLVVVLYNPASARRRAPLDEALRIARQHRPPTTPAGLVREAYRPGQSVRLTTLGALAADEVDMRTVVVIGCSRTAALGPWMVTRRGYLERTVQTGQATAREVQ